MSFWKKFFQKKERKVEQKQVLEKQKKPTKPAEVYQAEKGIILGPVLSEKARQLVKQGQFTFYVQPEANKVEIRQEIEKMFPVKVAEVKTIHLRKRIRGATRIPSVRPRRKKAVIKLKEGTIPIFE